VKEFFCRLVREQMHFKASSAAFLQQLPAQECCRLDSYQMGKRRATWRNSSHGAAGLFLVAHAFPRSRETASPRVADLARHRTELDPEFHYLADAPQSDPDAQNCPCYELCTSLKSALFHGHGASNGLLTEFRLEDPPIEAQLAR